MNIRKIVTTVEETRTEMGQPVNPPTRRAAAMAVIKNPFAGVYQENLEELINTGEELGGLLADIAVKALGIKPEELVHEQFPLAKIYVRAYDRRHAIELINAGANFHMRETLLSALGFGGALLRELGVSAERARAVVDDVRRRDDERLIIQQSEGMMGGAHLLKPEPLAVPKTQTRALNDETRAVIEGRKS